MATSKKRKRKSTKSATQSKRTTNDNKNNQEFLKKEIVTLVSLAICIFLQISLFGIGGFVGDALAGVLFGTFGFLGYIVPIMVFVGIAFLGQNKGNANAYIKAGSVLGLFFMFCTLFQLIIYGYKDNLKLLYSLSNTHKDGGGICGAAIVKLLVPALGMVGTYIVVILICIICFVLLTGKSFIGAVKKESGKVYETAKEKAEEQRERRAIEKENQKNEEQAPVKRKDKLVSGVSFNTTLTHESSDVHEIMPPEESLFKASKPEDIVIKRATPLAEATTEENYSVKPEVYDGQPEQVLPDAVSKEDAITRKRRSTIESRESAANEAINVENEIKKKEEKPKKAYKFPSLNLLTRGRASGGDSDDHLRETAMKLEQTLQNFNVNVTVTNVSCGPSVTRYELQPEQGVKVSKIVGLANDIKLNLAASDIRIEAPIPGKAAVGIEVPNKESTAVMLRDILESTEFKTHPSKLAFAVGRDIAGKVVVADIAKMPHVLIAGATGSGKSVCINTLIMSILFKASPEEVKLIMIDPKVVELKVYNGIPHLLIPVVTDPKKAAGALNWAVAEMTRRYQVFAEYNVRDLKGYNTKVETIEDIEDENKPQKLPQIVIVVDELADLMMVAPGEVEDAICRLAQLARACGIHLVVATQRPSVNVITGLIKANMPSRVAFAVSSGVDSRTIIDMNGAEKLLGKGDMLFYPAGYPKPARIQGTFVSDGEVQSVVDFLINQADGVTYNEEITKQINSAPIGNAAVFGGNEADDKDEYFIYAGKFVIESDKGSIGMLQRKFKIGFNRAARIMDQLCEAGVVGEEEGTKPRKVLMSMEEFEQYVDEYV
ncbi:MAG: DNA translocase FtsK [Tyzzerella sp.]|nr:DNA translocase FtsK [Tyzzerella sp.]